MAETNRRGHASRLALAAARPRVDVVVVLGGDGTLNEAANGLVGTETALAALPGGSTNVFARTIGLPERPDRPPSSGARRPGQADSIRGSAWARPTAGTSCSTPASASTPPSCARSSAGPSSSGGPAIRCSCGPRSTTLVPPLRPQPAPVLGVHRRRVGGRRRLLHRVPQHQPVHVPRQPGRSISPETTLDGGLGVVTFRSLGLWTTLAGAGLAALDPGHAAGSAAMSTSPPTSTTCGSRATDRCRTRSTATTSARSSPSKSATTEPPPRPPVTGATGLRPPGARSVPDSAPSAAPAGLRSVARHSHLAACPKRVGKVGADAVDPRPGELGDAVGIVDRPHVDRQPGGVGRGHESTLTVRWSGGWRHGRQPPARVARRSPSADRSSRAVRRPGTSRCTVSIVPLSNDETRIRSTSPPPSPAGRRPGPGSARDPSRRRPAQFLISTLTASAPQASMASSSVGTWSGRSSPARPTIGWPSASVASWWAARVPMADATLSGAAQAPAGAADGAQRRLREARRRRGRRPSGAMSQLTPCEREPVHVSFAQALVAFSA